MEFHTMTPAMFATVAREVFDKKTGYSNKTIRALDNEICESLIGTSYEVCSELWNLISPTLPLSSFILSSNFVVSFIVADGKCDEQTTQQS